MNAPARVDHDRINSALYSGRFYYVVASFPLPFQRLLKLPWLLTFM